MNFGVILVTALATLTARVSAQGYELDPKKVDERYNLILGIVGRGVPYGAHAAHKPRIGSAYAQPSVGYNKGTQSYNTGALGYNTGAPGYNTGAPGYNKGAPSYNKGALVYNNPTAYGGYNNVGRSYVPYNQAPAYGQSGQNGGYPSVGSAYANRNVGYNPTYGSSGSTGYKFGGGRVHPIFNNDLLYRPKVNNGDLGKDPVYIGGASGAPAANALYGQSGTLQKGFSSQPQFDAYGTRPGAVTKKFTGTDTIGSTYTGQQGTLYQNLPGYTNPFFRKA